MLNCYQIQQLCTLLCYFEHTDHFHISHSTHHLKYYIKIDHSWKLLTMFKWVILNYAMFMLNLNEPVKVAHLKNLPINQCLNSAILIEMSSNSLSESKKNSIYKTRKVLIETRQRCRQFLPDIAKYLSY